MDIVTLGEYLIDMFPSEIGKTIAEVEAFHPKPGGAPANVAVAAKRLGVDSAFIGKVGDDAFGHHLAAVLENEGISTKGLRFDEEARTTMAFIAKPDPNHAEFVFYRNPGADTRLTPDELDAELIRSAKIFHFGSLSLNHEPSRSATRRAVEIARDAGVMVSFDVNYRPPLWESEEEALEVIHTTLPHVDLLKVNEDEIRLLTGSNASSLGKSLLNELTEELLKLGPSVIIVTLGTDGSFFKTIEDSGSVPGFTVETVDAVGSGDSFISGVLSHIAQADAWPNNMFSSVLYAALRYGNAAGALTATQQGVIPALPTAAQVEDFLNQPH